MRRSECRSRHRSHPDPAPPRPRHRRADRRRPPPLRSRPPAMASTSDLAGRPASSGPDNCVDAVRARLRHTFRHNRFGVSRGPNPTRLGRRRSAVLAGGVGWATARPASPSTARQEIPAGLAPASVGCAPHRRTSDAFGCNVFGDHPQDRAAARNPRGFRSRSVGGRSRHPSSRRRPPHRAGPHSPGHAARPHPGRRRSTRDVLGDRRSHRPAGTPAGPARRRHPDPARPRLTPMRGDHP